MSGHAKLSPSGAYRWSVCTMAPTEEAGKPNPSSDASRWGTTAHHVAEICLRDGREAIEFFGMELVFWIHPESDSQGETLHDPLFSDFDPVGELNITGTVPIDEAVVECVASYVKFVRDLVATTGGTLHVEQRLPIGFITGERDAAGTADAVLATKDELVVIDLKGGRGRVLAYGDGPEEDVEFAALDDEDGDPVEPAERDPFEDAIPSPQGRKPNRQLAMYAAAALNALRAKYPSIHRVRMVIVQPRLHHVSEFAMSVDDLDAFIDTLRTAAGRTRTNPEYAPDADRCHFCTANGSCRGLQDAALLASCDTTNPHTAKPREVGPNELGRLHELLPLITLWLKAKEADIRERLLNGESVTGERGEYKIVAGKLGKRTFTDAEAAQRLLLDEFKLAKSEVFESKLKSIKTLESLAKAKGTDTPRLTQAQWEKLGALVKQSHTRAQVVLVSHPKPSLARVAADGFDNLDAANTDPFA